MLTLHKLLSVWLVLFSTTLLSSHCTPRPDTALKGEDDPGVRLIGGVPASPGEFPYVVSILTRGDSSNAHACGGTLVDMSTVITATHCVDAYRARDILVTAGAYYLREATLGIQQLRTVRQIIQYPGYDVYNHDISVLLLSSPFLGNETVATLPLARKNLNSTGRCYIAGWGEAENGAFSEEMRKGLITINSKDSCASVYDKFDRNYHICIGQLNGEYVSPCWGDTVGPLICTDTDGTKYMAGVTSWGPGCRTPGRPTVCMEISKYRDWLDNILNGSPTTTTTTTTTQRTTTTTTRRAFLKESNPESNEEDEAGHRGQDCNDDDDDSSAEN